MVETSQIKNQNESAVPTAEPRQRKGFFNSLWVDVAGLGLTLGAGVISTWRSVESIFYQNIKIAPEVDRLINNSKQKTQRIFHDVKSEATAEAKRQKLIKDWKEQAILHQGNMDEVLLETHGIRRGWAGLWDKSHLLRPHQKWEVAMNVGATMAVTLGALVTLAGMREIYNRQNELEDRLNSLNGHTR